MVQLNSVFEVAIWTTAGTFLNFTTTYQFIEFSEGIKNAYDVRSNMDLVLMPQSTTNFYSMVPILLEWQALYFQIPKQIFPFDFFIRVFELELWVAIICSVIIVTVLLYIFKIAWKRTLFEYIETILYAFTVTTECRFIRGMDSYRYFFRHLALFLIVIGTGFSAFLVSQLQHMRIELPFQNLKEIFEQNDYTLCVHKFSLTQDMLLDTYGNKSGILNNHKCDGNHFLFFKNICNNSKNIYSYYNTLIETIVAERYKKYF